MRKGIRNHPLVARCFVEQGTSVVYCTVWEGEAGSNFWDAIVLVSFSSHVGFLFRFPLLLKADKLCCFTTCHGYSLCAVQIDSDNTLLVHVSKPYLRMSACTGDVPGALPPAQRSSCFVCQDCRGWSDCGQVGAWSCPGCTDTTGVKIFHTCQLSFLVSKCWSPWSDGTEWRKRKSWMLKPKRCVQHVFFPYIGMRCCSLDVTDKIPSTLAGFLNSTPATGKWCFQESLNTIFEIWVNF